MEIYAIRGATTVDFDNPADVDQAVAELMGAVYSENGIGDDDICSIIFSQTSDIRSRNAAASCRKAGYAAKVPLFCVQEADIAGGLPRTIRVLVTINHGMEKEPRMVYQRKAASLRPDFAARKD
ncbi:MAG: chorismate mutase [Candidatus Ornithospirochaeta sp.]|nr:chorismate mutase [Candidatus Ornithospirochaeta sp.]